MKKQIIIRKIAEHKFTITIDGNTRKDFISLADCKEWVGCMFAHGLFKGYEPVIENNGEMTPVVPTYEYEVEAPGICKFIAI